MTGKSVWGQRLVVGVAVLAAGMVAHAQSVGARQGAGSAAGGSTSGSAHAQPGNTAGGAANGSAGAQGGSAGSANAGAQGGAGATGGAGAQGGSAGSANAGGANAGSAGAGAQAGGAGAAGASGYSGTPWVNVRPPHTAAGLTPDSVHRAVTRGQAAITECYTHVLATDARAHALVNVRLQVIAGGLGTIDRVRTTPRNQDLETCLQGALGRVEWPNPHNVPATEVNLQIDLAPAAPPPAHGARH